MKAFTVHTQDQSHVHWTNTMLTAPKITSQFQIVSKHTKRGGNVAK